MNTEHLPITEEQALYAIAKRVFVDDDLFYKNNYGRLKNDSLSYGEYVQLLRDNIDEFEVNGYVYKRM